MIKKNKEKIQSIIKFLFEWFVIYYAARLIPSKEIEFNDLFLIATIGAVACAFINMYSPELSDKVTKSAAIALGTKTILNKIEI